MGASVKEIYKRELPPSTTISPKIGDITSLAEFASGSARTCNACAVGADSRARQGLLEMVLDRNQIEVPESLIAREHRAMESELDSTLRQAASATRILPSV